MKILPILAASALALASTTASAGNVSNVGVADPIVVVPTMEPAGSSAGSLGSLGTGGAIALGVGALALIALAASSSGGSDDDEGNGEVVTPGGGS